MAAIKKSVVVGLSGGVDSAVAAALLLEQGYQVTGISLSFWKAGENLDLTVESYADAQHVAQHLNIPWKLVDEKQSFHEKVINYYFESLGRGLTPNPCIICNKNVKWQMLLDIAGQLGATHVATGHYARILRTGTYELHEARDKTKDQSYFLSILGQSELSRTIFPLGDLTKTETRNIAKGKGIPVASRPESQDQCFFGGMQQPDFIQYYAPDLMKKGEIVHQDGRVLGEHHGLAAYTIGQRKGIKIPNTSALYVIRKDIPHNRLVVGEKNLLGAAHLTAGDVNWVSGYPPSVDFNATVKIRYRAAGLKARIIVGRDGRLEVDLPHPVRDITPGQAMVIYDGEKCLGMGFIE